MKGKQNFIWKRGVVGWGGLMFVMMATRELFRSHTYHWAFVDYVFLIIFGLVVCSVAGYCVGLLWWKTCARRFSETSPGAQ